MSTVPTAAGWHGKLPSLGDFASRRLDLVFVREWDAWLSEGLAELRAGDGWPEAYLASPSWRFLLMPSALPGPLGATAWVGVLMPSVDRVGRYYPFTLAQPLDALPIGADSALVLWNWLERLDDIAGEALHDDWSIERLETALVTLGIPAPREQRAAVVWPGADVRSLPLGDLDAAPALFGAQAAVLWQERMQGCALWFSAAELAAPRLLASNGLDAPGLIGRLLGEDRMSERSQ